MKFLNSSRDLIWPSPSLLALWQQAEFLAILCNTEMHFIGLSDKGQRFEAQHNVHVQKVIILQFYLQMAQLFI